ncbi:aldehyde dehydrogenase family protein, partial [Mycobacterium kansasii]
SAACAAAAGAATAYRNTPPHERARFLEVIAEEIDARAEALIARATRETALPNPRISGEVSRTSNQLRLFAAELREGS